MLLKNKFPMLIALIIFGSVFIPRIPHLLGDTLLIISIFLLLAIYLFTASRQGTPYARATPLDLPILLLILFVILSLVRSLNFYDSLRETFKLSAYVTMFFLIIYDRNKEKTAKVITWAILVTGLFVSLYGVYEHITVVKSFWFPRQAVFSTFPNPNHLGSYAVATLALALGFLLFDRLKKQEKVFLIIIAIASFMGLYASNSKGSLLSLIVSLLILAALKGRKSLKVYTVIMVVIIAGLLFLISPLAKPILPSGIMNDPYTYERISLWKETLKYIADYPLLGTGIGTFGDYYPQYKSMAEMRSAEFAHNEFLNIWAEIGFFGLMVCLWSVVLLFKHGFALMKKTDHVPEIADIQPLEAPSISKGMSSGLLAASGGILAQSMVEFNLRTPGIAVAFVSMAAIIISFSITDKETEKRPLTEDRKITVPVIAITGFIFLVLLLLMPLVADYYARQGDRFYRANNYLRAMVSYKQAVKFNPLFTPYHETLGDLYLVEGEILRDENFIYGAYEQYNKCVTLYPRNVFYHLKLARFYANYGALGRALKEYKQVLTLAPNVGIFKQEYERLRQEMQKRRKT